MKNKALFLDRDGVINVAAPEGDYILSRAAFRLQPSSIPLIRFARAAGYLVIVVTNQRCVSLGLLSEENLEGIHMHMRELLKAEDADVDAVYFCVHGDEDACACRKPKPGMLLVAAHDFNIDLSASVMIGDKESDMEAGRAAGCKTNIVWKNS
ncbi:MAG: HAD family hydrolase [Candidatus Pacebacteria bacterium]|nr:HAD family hydrolase [Candidatus Paceibacterota bacterium]